MTLLQSTFSRSYCQETQMKSGKTITFLFYRDKTGWIIFSLPLFIQSPQKNACIFRFSFVLIPCLTIRGLLAAIAGLEVQELHWHPSEPREANVVNKSISSVKGSTIYHPDPIALCIDLASFDYILLLWCMWLPVPAATDVTGDSRESHRGEEASPTTSCTKLSTRDAR